MPVNQPNAQCSCGAVQFKVNGTALRRGFCHCTICKEYTQFPYSDISIFRASDVEVPSENLVEYNVYRPPPSVQRGKCKACGGAALELMNIFPFPKLVIVPTGNLQQSQVIDPTLHMFFDKCTTEINDDLPKYGGYWRSQFALFMQLIPELWRTRKRA